MTCILTVSLLMNWWVYHCESRGREGREREREEMLFLCFYSTYSLIRDVSSALVQSLVHFFVSQPIPPPDTLRVQPSGMLSSFTCKIIIIINLLPYLSLSSSSSWSPLSCSTSTRYFREHFSSCPLFSSLPPHPGSSALTWVQPL